MDAEVEEDAELSPSAAVASVRSWEEEGSGGWVSVSEAGAGEETERVASCLLRPFCACET